MKEDRHALARSGQIMTTLSGLAINWCFMWQRASNCLHSGSNGGPQYRRLQGSRFLKSPKKAAASVFTFKLWDLLPMSFSLGLHGLGFRV